MKLKIKKLHPDAVVPQYQTAGAACFDLHATDNCVTLSDRTEPAVLCTGLAFGIPAGHVMLVFSRSSHGFHHNTRLSNCVGVIDSDYIGEVMVKLTADDGGWLSVRKGDRIAQAMIVPIPRVEFEVAQELTTTERGTGGFGSTGA